MTAWDQALAIIADQQALIRTLISELASPGGEDLVLVALGELGSKIDILIQKAGTMATALENLQAADTALKQEVVTFLADVAAKLAASPAAASDPAIQAVANDVTAQVTALAAGDPGVVVPPAPASPAS